MNPPWPIELVTFDLWGTILQAPAQLPALLADYLTGYSPLAADQLLALITETGRRLDAEAISTGLERPSRDKLAALLHLARAHTPQPDDLETAISQHLRLAPLELIEPDVLFSVAGALADQGVRIAFASNSGFLGTTTMRRELTRLGLLALPNLIRAVFSEDVGAAKPSERFFAAACHGFQPQAVLHVGDNHRADVEGIERFGGAGLLFHRAPTAAALLARQIGSLADILSTLPELVATGR
jgi:FMN phosphatase YigB (HAD superfamily)